MNDLYASDFPELVTDRLHLRQLQKNDDDSLFLLRTDKEVSRYLDRPKTQNIEDARMFIAKIQAGIIRKEWLYWAICQKNNPALIGTICLLNMAPHERSAEIGFELSPDFQKQGFMSEALKQVIRYSFQTIGLTKLDAFTHPDNQAARTVLQNNDFIPDPTRHDPEFPHLLNYSHSG